LPEPTAFSPLEIDGLADHHCHCDYSIDAKGSIDDYCRAALQRGLAEICFTTHYDANPRADDGAAFIRVKGEKKPVGLEPLKYYAEDVEAAREKFYPLGLSVQLGLEYSWYQGCEPEVIRLKEAFPFEYLLVGIHELGDICHCCEETFERCFERYSLEQMVERYFQDATAAAKSGLFNTVAHLDYYKKYGERFFGAQVHRAHAPYLDGLFRALSENNTTLEINTAARRKGFDSYYPQVEIINLARRAGVDVIHLGSDAHLPEQVGFDFDAAAALVPSPTSGCGDQD
jgi:histidinol-phosphatase (PHP family)